MTVTVRFPKRPWTLSATAVEVVKKHHRALHRRLTGHRKNATTMTFTGRLSPGKWLVSITGKPASGYAMPKAARRTVRVVAASKSLLRQRAWGSVLWGGLRLVGVDVQK